MSIPSYPNYQQTDFPWMRKAPAHWRVTPFKRCVEIMNGADHKHILAAEGYPVFGSGGVFAYATDYLYDGESVLLGRKGTIDRPRYVCGRFWTVDTMFWTKMLPTVVGRFIYYLATTFPFEYYATDTALPSMAKEDLEGHDVAIPPIDEQVSIVAFLDSETRRIDELVEEQRRLIALLDEKRQAVISHAVTKGLNPDAPMKAVGIEWLPESPAHWGSSALKLLAKDAAEAFTDGDWIESPYITDEGVRLLQTGNVGIGMYKEQGFRYVSEQTFEQLGCTEVAPRDVLICRLDGPVGRACLAPDLGVRMITSVDNAILKVRDDVLPEFVVAVLSSVPWLSWMDAICRVGGGFRLRVSRAQLGELRIQLPPLSEQRAIAEYLAAQALRSEALVKEAQHAIALLLERRAALITAAVTGQIDVRALAPSEAP